MKIRDIPANPAQMGIPETSNAKAPPNKNTAMTSSLNSGFLSSETVKGAMLFRVSLWFGYLDVLQFKSLGLFSDITFFQIYDFITDVNNILQKEQGHSQR